MVCWKRLDSKSEDLQLPCFMALFQLFLENEWIELDQWFQTVSLKYS